MLNKFEKLETPFYKQKAGIRIRLPDAAPGACVVQRGAALPVTARHRLGPIHAEVRENIHFFEGP